MYLQLRLTPEFCSSPTEASFKNIWVQLKNIIMLSFGTLLHAAACKENFNKFGEPTHEHFHFNIELDDHITDLTPEKIQRKIRAISCRPSGPRAYAVKVLEELNDENRWWRYLLKEKGGAAYLTEPSFPDNFDIEINKLMAQDERSIQINRNLKAREKTLQTHSFRNKMYAHFDKQYKQDEITKCKIFSDFIQYYQDDNRVPPFNTMMNMVYDYLVYSNRLSAEEFFKLKYPEEI